MQFNAGQRVTAAMLTAATGLQVVKGSTQTVTSSTTLQNDTALLVAVLANTSYLFDCDLFYNGGTLGSSDLQWQWAGPSGATLLYQAVYGDTLGNPQVRQAGTFASVFAAGTAGGGTNRAASMSGSLVTGPAAGTLQLTWAQNTSNGTGTTVLAGSALALWQVP